MTTAILHHGDCLQIMRGLADASVDAVVTDPPYELGFMGRKWDSTGIAYNVLLWAEVLRVLKPGGHLLAFGATRTYHRMACAIEDAGFEVRDSLHWMYGQGFPKSLDIAKAIDKAQGHWRGRASGPALPNAAMSGGNYGRTDKGSPVTEEAAEWQGWGTALKPAHEPIVLARKPLSEATVAANVLRWGTGALNIDAGRIGRSADAPQKQGRYSGSNVQVAAERDGGKEYSQGRWPANVLLDEDAAAELDTQSGQTRSVGGPHCSAARPRSASFGAESAKTTFGHEDSGGASRFFYIAKPSPKERNAGLDGLSVRPQGGLTGRSDGSLGSVTMSRNIHPTVKPVRLMEYLISLVTPPAGIVLDPFLGSGTTGVAAARLGFGFIGIEKEQEYLDIARARVAAVSAAPL